MEWQIIVALVVVAPLILFPAALIWYLSIGGLIAALRQGAKAVVKEGIGAAAHQHPTAA
jgi:hypothetical protein